MSMTKPNRRQFMISTAAATVAATTGTALAAISGGSGPGRAHLVGLGDAGGAFLDFVLPRLPPDFERNIHRPATPRLAGLLARSFLGLDLPPFLPGDPVVVLTGLGGRMGDTAPRLVEGLLEKGHPSVVVASLPFAFEGKARRERAEAVARTMEGLAARLVVVDYQVVLEEESSPDAAFHQIENLAVDVVLRIGRGLHVPSVRAWSSYVFSDHRDIPLPRL